MPGKYTAAWLGASLGHLRAHFGLGDATSVDTLRIEWPSGIVQELTDVAPNQILTVTEPAGLIPQAAGGFQIQSWINQNFEVQASVTSSFLTIGDANQFSST